MHELVPATRRQVLDNGLTLLVRPDRSAPVVALLSWVRSGYFHETDDVAGIAHVAEHMYFNGTTTRPGPEDVAREVKALGGELNASTSYAMTMYHVTLPSGGLARAADIQADALSCPLLDPGVLEKELGAVVQEARRKLDNPSAVVRETMYARAYDVHRIRRWRIGEEAQLRTYTREQVRSWWDDHYVPSNVVVAAVGDFDASEALATLGERFGRLPPGALRRVAGPPEPPRPPGLRHARLSGDVRQVSFVAGFHTVPTLHPDAPALDVLATVLADGRASRLVSELRERRRLLTGVDVVHQQHDDVGMLEIGADLAPEQLEPMRLALFEELGRAASVAPTREELARASRRIEASHVMGCESMLGQARVLASAEALGDLDLADRWLREALAVTAEDVLRVAAQYLSVETCTIVEHVPESSDAPAEPVAEALDAALRAGRSARTSRVGAAPGAASGEWSLVDLPGGARLAHLRARQPTVSVVASFDGGRWDESPEVEGRTLLMLSLLARGTARRSAEEVAQEIEGMGSALRPVLSEDGWGLATTLLREDRERGAAILFDALLGPTFPDAEVEKARAIQLQRHGQLRDQPLPWALALSRRAAWGEQPPGLLEIGRPESVERLAADDLRRAHAAAIGRRLDVAVVGDLALDEASALVARHLEGRPASVTAPASAPAHCRAGEEIVETRRRAQTSQAFAFPGVVASDPDLPALEVIAAFTSSLGGRFFEEVRTKRGLAYVVGSGASSSRRSGLFVAYLATSPGDEEAARDVLLAEARRVAQEPARGEELERSREYLRGGHALGQQGTMARAARAIAWLASGRGLEDMERWPQRIGAVSTEDVARVAARCLVVEKACRAVVRGA